MPGPKNQKLLRLCVPPPRTIATIRRARELRNQPTRSELILWECLRKNRLGTRFRRQQWIGPLVVDFYAPAARLAVEIDGPVHASQADYDRERQAVLESLGLRFARISSEAVLFDLQGVLTAIDGALKPPFPA